ncbi:putative MATE efflux family protein [Hibiscus syriacus]|uniref:MATE efflux family protein n=1 Tax=Hibiscus syriacus TaxID=106335 RepID=A0A6A2XSX8_HIBSY|nr:putative MATE efflux family protein [Hibiscus syriacus]
MDEALLPKKGGRIWEILTWELVVSMTMAGHLGELPLSGIAIATAFCNVTGFSLLCGLSGGLETLNGQAYGAKQYHRIGSYTYCSIICALPICLPVSPLDVRFLQSQSLVLPLLYTSIATLCFHVSLCWVLVFESGFGYTGAALAISFSYWFNVILLGFYMGYSSSCQKTRTLQLKDVFMSVQEFFLFAVPSAVMACLEWWSFEILVLMSGLLPNSKLETSVLSICLSSDSLHYHIPLGISIAASTRISNALGAGNPQAAQVTSFVSVLHTLLETLIASSILFCCRHVFGYAYSSENEVVLKVAQIVPLVCLSFIADGLHATGCGIVRGIGWQHIGAYANLAAYYLGGIPAGILCGFVLKLRAEGLWIGMFTTAKLICSVVFSGVWRENATKISFSHFDSRSLEVGAGSGKLSYRHLFAVGEDQPLQFIPP